MNLRQDCEDQYCHQNQAQHNQVLQIECQGKTHKQNHLSWGGTIDIQVKHFYGNLRIQSTAIWSCSSMHPRNLLLI